jgi:hypothetical protein
MDRTTKWATCEACGQDKPNVESYRHDSRPDGVMLCDECYEGLQTEGNEFNPTAGA